MGRGKVIDVVEEGGGWMALYCKCDGCGRGASEAVLFDGSTSVRYPCTRNTRTRNIVAKGS